MDALERIERLEREFMEMKALRGTVRLGIGWVSAAWTVLGGLLAVAFFIAQLASAQASLAQTVDTMRKDMDYHFKLPGHPTEVERVEGLKSRIDRLERPSHAP